MLCLVPELTKLHKRLDPMKKHPLAKISICLFILAHLQRNTECTYNDTNKGVIIVGSDLEKRTVMAEFENMAPSDDLETQRNTIAHDENPTMLHAIEKDDLEMVKTFISQGASLDALHEDGDIPLFYAIDLGRKEIADFLIKQGASVNILNHEGETPLFLAVKNEQKEIIELLLEYGAQVDLSNSALGTPLHIAAFSSRTDIINILIAHGADVNSISKSEQRTPLHIAARRGDAESTLFLIDHGANINALDKRGRTPLMRALLSGNIQVALMLIQKKISLYLT
jgi:ankyrin repeat protein